jgi:hypothetical protein
MKLWLISQDANGDYDTYDSAVVAAPTAEYAQTIHPGGSGGWKQKSYNRTWCDAPHQVTVRLIGDAIEGTEAGVILASFNAG